VFLLLPNLEQKLKKIQIEKTEEEGGGKDSRIIALLKQTSHTTIFFNQTEREMF